MIRLLGSTIGIIIALFILLLVILALLPASWLGSWTASAASRLLDADVEIARLDFQPFNLTQSLSLSSLEVSDGPSSAQLQVSSLTVAVDLPSLLKADLVFDEVILKDAQVSAAVDEDGQSNWQYLTGDEDAGADAQQNSGTGEWTVPEINKLRIEGLQISFLNEQADIDLDMELNGTASTHRPDTESYLQVAGVANNTPLVAEVAFSYLGDVLAGVSGEEIPVSVDSMIHLGDSEIKVAGVIGNPAELRKLDMTFVATLGSLDDVQAFSPIDLPVLPSMTVSGELQRDEEEWLLHHFAGRLGDSDLSGDVRLDPSTTPMTLYANLFSSKLDLDAVGGLFGVSPGTGESSDDRGPDSADDEQLLPDQPVAARALADLFNGAMNYHAEAVSSTLWPVDLIDVRVEIERQVLLLRVNSFGLAGGTIEGTIAIDTSKPVTESELELDIRRVDLNKVVSAFNLGTEAAGLIAGRVNYWLAGDTIADMAASADGGAFLLMTGGQLDAVLAALIGIDISEALIILLNQGEEIKTPIECAFADLHTENGVMDISTLVFDTEDTIILGDGSINWNDESLDLILEPHPKDASALAASTAAHITGTLSSPEVAPGRTLLTRVAAAAVLGSILAPAAGLLPFLNVGTGEDSVYCSGMVSALDNAR